MDDYISHYRTTFYYDPLQSSFLDIDKVVAMKALSELEPKYREALTLWIEHPMTYSALADILGVSITTAQHRLRKAIEALRIKLKVN